MTVKECYEIAVSFLPEKPEENAELQKFMLSWCNMLLAETLVFENIRREEQKENLLSHAPLLLLESDEIPYGENFVRAVFPYGMARWIFRENDDAAGENLYYSLYINAIGENTPALKTEVADVYR